MNLNLNEFEESCAASRMLAANSWSQQRHGRSVRNPRRGWFWCHQSQLGFRASWWNAQWTHVDSNSPMWHEGFLHVLTMNIRHRTCFEALFLDLSGGFRCGWRVRNPFFCGDMSCTGGPVPVVSGYCVPQGYEFIEGLLLLGCTDAHNMSV